MKNTRLIEILVAVSVVATWVSQSLLDLAVGLIGLLWLSQLIRYRHIGEAFPSKVMNKIFPVFFGYFFVACLGFAFNARPEAEVANNLMRFNWILALYPLTWAFTQTSFSESFFRKAFAFLLLPAIYGFNIYINHGTDLISKTETGFRVVGFVNSATYHAHIAGFFVILGLGYLIGRNLKKAENLVIFSVTLIVFLSLLFTKTRGALLAVVAAAAVYLLLSYGRKAFRWLVGIALVGAVVLLATPLRNNLSRGSDDCRFLLAKVHIEIVKQYPILGIGYRDNMRNLSDFWTEKAPDPNCDVLRVEGTQAHNQYINVAATTGLAGLFFYLFFILYFAWINWRWLRRSRSVAARVVMALQVYFWLSCMTEITFEFAKIRFLILCVWAYMAAQVARLQESTERN